MRPSGRIKRASILVLTVMAIGIAGYILIEDMTFTQAFYMTIITIATVGFREVKELSTGGQYFTIFIILCGVGTLFYFVTSLFEVMLEGLFGEAIGRRRMTQRIKALRDHVIICGFGRVGENVCREFQRAGRDFVVVEKDEETVERAMEEGFLAVKGDATHVEILEEAGVARAKGLVSALHTDADNLFVTLTARTINPRIFIVTRCVYPKSTEKLIYAGADRVISPYLLSARRMANLILRPNISDFLDVVVRAEDVEFRVEEMRLERDSPYAGKTIGEANIKTETGVLVLALRGKDSREFDTNPGSDTRLNEGDTLIVMGTKSQLDNFQKRMGSL